MSGTNNDKDGAKGETGAFETADMTAEPDQTGPAHADPVSDAAWDAPRADGSKKLHIDVDGFAGPLDLLLTLARAQKLDITKISILALADQYLEFVEQAKTLQLELAADYLVMAAWLAFMKSRLLLPDDDDEDQPSGEELAAHLAFRLQRLDAMRDAAAKLMARNRLDRDIFARGDPEIVITTKNSEYVDNLYDLLSSYAQRRQRTAITHISMKRLPVMQIGEAKRNLEQLLGRMTDWGPISHYIEQFAATEGPKRSSLASGFSASLELVREGKAELRQEKSFAPLYIKAARKIQPVM